MERGGEEDATLMPGGAYEAVVISTPDALSHIGFIGRGASERAASGIRPNVCVLP